MKNVKILGVVAGAMLAVQTLHANSLPQINGSIAFNSGVELNTASVNTAREVTAWISPMVTSDSGSFAGLVINTPGVVTMKPDWFFNSGAVSALWTAGAFTFNLTSSSIVFQGFGGVYVSGTGMISAHGYAPTLGTWTFTASNPGAGNPLVFSFQAAVGALPSVPDGGMTVALLGASLVGVQAVRRKLNK